MNNTTMQSKNNHLEDGGGDLLQAKKVVLGFHEAIEKSSSLSNKHEDGSIRSVMEKYTVGNDYVFRCVHPFREIRSASNVTQTFWKPFQQSFTRMQRRPDIFIAGKNSIGKGMWVLSMGHFLGLFDQDWLNIRATRQVATVRYAEFSEVCLKTSKVLQTGLFLDIVGLMQSVGMNPLPPSTGAHFHYPGPRTHDGLIMHHNAPEHEGIETQALVNRMVEDLSAVNHLMTCSPDVLRKTWKEDMLWYGPAGIGATYTIPRYQEQHQLPFRTQVGDKKFHGHQVRIAEGNYAAFFGWPMNLSNAPQGGFMGLPGGAKDCPMQVVDVYRREGDKLAENWVLIDVPWYLKHQGLDILQRTTGIMNPLTVSKKVPEEVEEEEIVLKETILKRPVAETVSSESETEEPPTKKQLVVVDESSSVASESI